YKRMKRRQAREYALQTLFQIDLTDIDVEEALANVLQESKEQSNEFLESLVFGYVNNSKQIDDMIQNNVENWTLERISNIDRAILRIAVCEMTQIEDIPDSVTINEAIEISKIYG